MRAPHRMPRLLIKSASLALSYLMVLSLCAPFALRRAEAALLKVSLPAPIIPQPAMQMAERRDAELLVRFRQGVSDQEKSLLMVSKGARQKGKLRGGSEVEQLEAAAGQTPEALAAELLLDPRVEFAEPNFLIRHDEVTPSDQRFVEQWALKNTGQNGGTFGSDIGVTSAWNTTTGSSSTIIAVIDSGVDFTHPDLKNSEWTNPAAGKGSDLHGWDYITNSGEIKDENGHGTAVAGIIAAQGNDSVGISGVMWSASLMSLRVLDNTGTGDVAKAVEAIDYAVVHGAQVINLSWGTDGYSAALKDAIDRAGKSGVVVVCSAGNGGRDIENTPYYPASFDSPNLIAVASTNSSDLLESWSNRGASHVAVAAPGANILTTQTGGGYRVVSGTSASAPFVSGIAGLIKTVRPWLTANGTAAAIKEGSRPVGNLWGQVSTGGVANAPGALGALHAGGRPSMDNGSGGNGAADGNGSSAGNGNGNGNAGNAGQSPGFQRQRKSGSSAAPPPAMQGAPGPNLPNLDEIRKRKAEPASASAPIQSNLACIDCDITAGGAGASGSDPYFGRARIQPSNRTGQPGVTPSSQNFNWALPLVSLAGRAGLDLNIALSYNSLVWTKQDSSIQMNADRSFPAPGFHLGFPILQASYYNSQYNGYVYIMVTGAGERVELRQIGGRTDAYMTADGSYTQLVDYGGGNMSAFLSDGTRYYFERAVGGTNFPHGEFRCTKIKDRNGNFISATYDSDGHVRTMTDTLSRVITFNYDAEGNLSSISQPGLSQAAARFTYSSLQLQLNFGGLTVVSPFVNGYQLPVLTEVKLADDSYYAFSYTSWGQVWKITHYASNGRQLAYTSYNLPGSPLVQSTAQTDCPRFSRKYDWAANWNMVSNVEQEAETSYEINNAATWYKPEDNSYQTGGMSQVTMPDGTIHKTYYHTSGWDNGLPQLTETWANSFKQRWVSMNWTQGDMTLSYPAGPHAVETNIYDPSGNRRRTTVSYNSPFTLPSGASCDLPTDVYEYGVDPNAVVRRTHTDYITDNVFLYQHLVGLVSARKIYDAAGTAQSITLYRYDQPSFLESMAGGVNPTGHDAYYDAGFTARGNLTSVQQVSTDPNDPPNTTKELKSGYNIVGEVTFTRDMSNHQQSFFYTDSFTDGVNRNTFAYPTKVQDGDGKESFTKYDYNLGAVREAKTPSPNAGGALPSQTIVYDSIGRLEKVINDVTGTYTRYVYSADADYMEAFTTILSSATSDEVRSVTHFDGAGRVRATATQDPANPSPQQYMGQLTVYDKMGRVAQQSNPTQMYGNWNPLGTVEDPAWYFTLQAYDWKGRPTITTNPDGSQRINTYGGCGCAGGEVVTSKDEAGRQRRATKDVLGRLNKVEELNWDGSVYSTTNYDYNLRDQLNWTSQQGQVRSFTYDGFGRLKTRTTPEQGTTTYSYLPDDLVQTVTDARGATATYNYNARHQVTGITYGIPAGKEIGVTPNVSYTYDDAGNRTGMTDGLGSVAYTYDQLSNMKTETRTFTGLGTYQLAYDYNPAGELTKLTANPNSWNVQTDYEYDKLGRVKSVKGNYGGNITYISGLLYRAFGAAKQITYGNSKVLNMEYDPRRLFLTRWDVQGRLGSKYSYNNFDENNTGRVTYAENIYDRTLDRMYDYDQVGRLTVSHTGSEAQATIGQNTWGHPDGPYSQGYGYDVWGNTTSRGGWGGSNPSYTASYTNKNQRTAAEGFTYDEAGNLYNEGSWQFRYDATGQQASATAPWSSLTSGYDGDRLRVKKTEGTATTYYLRSSVLGGQAIAEIQNGAMAKG
ncbi:MAG TPA: S8 family serine peptidase, partial [Pyrinomonadaceae bacterium]